MRLAVLLIELWYYFNTFPFEKKIYFNTCRDHIRTARLHSA
jgi:hypothetical protein